MAPPAPWFFTLALTTKDWPGRGVGLDTSGFSTTRSGSMISGKARLRLADQLPAWVIPLPSDTEKEPLPDNAAKSKLPLTRVAVEQRGIDGTVGPDAQTPAALGRRELPCDNAGGIRKGHRGAVGGGNDVERAGGRSQNRAAGT